VTDRAHAEYAALRATIRERGTTRVWIFATGVAVWAALTTAALAMALPPIAALLPLTTLAATYEAVRALHVGVERIGRYLLAFHADEWEQQAGAFGSPAGAMRADPLFTTPFIIAAVLTLIPLMTTTPIVLDWIAGGGGAAALIGRVLYTRTAAARQRAVDTARFEELRRGR
jgi:hypothetical protein